MVQIAAFKDIQSRRKQHRAASGYRWNTMFFAPPAGMVQGAHAYYSESMATRVLRTHFHDVDEFQVIMTGGGALGKHTLVPNTVHYVRAYTPYGPIVAGRDGLSFLTMRPARHTGAYYLPEARDELLRVPNRDPWQISERPRFDDEANGSLCPLSHIKDECGLAAYSLRLAPNAAAYAPGPSTSRGQYIVVTRGSLIYRDKQHETIALVFMEPHESAFQLVAGPEGLDALILNFPRNVAPTQVGRATSSLQSADFRVWQCQLCSFVYDETKGMPDEGVAPGTRWEDVPDDWTCPDCAASKRDFQMAIVS